MKISIPNVVTTGIAMVAITFSLSCANFDWHKLLMQGEACATQIAADEGSQIANTLLAAADQAIAGGTAPSSAAWQATLETLGAHAGVDALRCAGADLLSDLEANKTAAVVAMPVPACRRGGKHRAVSLDHKAYLEALFKKY